MRAKKSAVKAVKTADRNREHPDWSQLLVDGVTKPGVTRPERRSAPSDSIPRHLPHTRLLSKLLSIAHA